MRVLNFAGGPAQLPEEVLREAQEAIWELDSTGVGVLETGHRTPAFDRILADAIRDIRTAGDIPDSHEVLFIPGGAHMAWALLPLNALQLGDRADLIDTGTFPTRAHADAVRAASLIGAQARTVWSGREANYAALPTDGDLPDCAGARYVHYCSNNTIEGTQWRRPPHVAAPLVCDATSEILSRPWPYARHAMVMAAAQKNLGIAGIAIAVVHREFLESMRDDLPVSLNLRALHAQGNRVNTPPVFAIWMCGRMAAWILRNGGVHAMADRNQQKAAAVYRALDECAPFYTGAARPHDRSVLNVSFRCATPALDKAFVAEAATHGMVGLEGHRTAGGIRASMYNAMPLSAAHTLADFMRQFAARMG